MSAEWRARAACRGTDPDLFFPTATRGPMFETQVMRAKAVCGRCPVRATCLADALERLPYGIAGGLTEDERRALRGEVSVTDPAQRRVSEGRRLLANGLSPSRVARRCEVSERTAQRWAAAARTGQEVA